MNIQSIQKLQNTEAANVAMVGVAPDAFAEFSSGESPRVIDFNDATLAGGVVFSGGKA